MYQKLEVVCGHFSYTNYICKTMSGVSTRIHFHPESLFTKPVATSSCYEPPGRERPPDGDHAPGGGGGDGDHVLGGGGGNADHSHRERCSSSNSSNSIETEFTHFKPIRRAPVCGPQLIIVKPTPIRTCTLTIKIHQTRDTEARIKQEKMDCELAWRIHKQEKRFMLRQSSTRSPTRKGTMKMQDENRRVKQEIKHNVRKEEKRRTLQGKMRQEEYRKQQSRRKCRLY